VASVPRSAVEIAIGGALAFGGGSFMTTIAAVEAMAAAGFDRVWQKAQSLWRMASTGQGFENPSEVYGVLIAAVVAVRSRLAQVVVIGSAAGDLALKYIEPRAVPMLRAVVSEQYRALVPGVVQGACRLTGVLLCWSYQRHVSAAQCAGRGRLLLERGLIRVVGPRHQRAASCVAWAVAGLGVAVQLRRDFRPLGVFYGLSVLDAGLTRMVTAL